MADCAGVISQLFIYPVKSCAGIEINASQLTPTGLAMDREWMIVDQDGQFLTQRQCPHMVWITPSLSDRALTLSAPNSPSVSVALDYRGQAMQVTVWRDTLCADDMGDEVANWLDSFLAIPGKRFRLVRFSTRARRLSAPEWTQGVEAPNKFSDGFALLVVTQRALDELNERLVLAGHPSVGMSRFRPNLVIESMDAHAEDHIAQIAIQTAGGTVTLDLVKPCPRCAIPDIDPYSASSSPEVNQTLSDYRRLDLLDGAICFGMNAVVRHGNELTLHVGLPVEANYKI
ncbi:MOSC domain-containing protein [Orrella sp. NBD-18]|uniref:MOSC domain-containing protein n=1 Tax=Sheuella amnicola TaxID=2707330 RepID=A0A6B2QZM8_9BURK|nr:MOSC N-terminal beta barrel domain-containing protein [Sheuella amnicola]NDY82619.1 MOSC domain-containing protein [Sheuella amnicola]HBI82127.1 MOSC domain-containing protein [Alcaligenaceae bacterium]